MTTDIPAVKPVLPITRAVFTLSIILAGIAGVQLYVLADRTDRYFAWTIGNPLSAAFLGGGFWAGTLLLLFSMRESAWANVRVAMAAVLTFVPFITLTTFMHLSPFHFHSHDVGPRVAAWAWLAVYVVVPFAILAFVVLQIRARGGDPVRIAPVPLWIRLLLGVNAAVSLVIGLTLFMVSDRLFSLWPWQLTTLTAQTTGTVFLTIAIASFWFLQEKDWIRGRVGSVPYLVVGLLQLVALARFHTMVEWHRPGTWLYVVYLFAVLIGGCYSIIMIWRLDRHQEIERVPTLRQT